MILSKRPFVRAVGGATEGDEDGTGGRASMGMAGFSKGGAAIVSVVEE